MSDNHTPNGRRRSTPPGPLSPLIPGRTGRPSFSVEALRERIEAQFQEETAHRSDILLDLDSEDKRRATLAEIADYVLAVESVTLSGADRAALIERVYRNLFSFGPLDEYLRDDSITEITINGPHTVHIRHGAHPMQPVPAAFDDREHLAGVLARVLSTAGATLPEGEPFFEAGVMLLGRATRISLVGPPVNPDYSLEIRLHPSQPLTLDDLDRRFEVLPPQAAALLRAILSAGHGLLIVGDVGLGKTTLAGALLATLPAETRIESAERAAEIHLPAQARRHTPIPPAPDDPGRDFDATIRAALESAPSWLVVDEIRGGESAALWEALTCADPPCYLWVFRGDPVPDRLRSALSMVIRQLHPAVEQATIHRALASRLPFVVALRLLDGQPRLQAVAEWALADDSASTLDLRPVLQAGSSGWTFTGYRPTHSLNLPADFWASLAIS